MKSVSRFVVIFLILSAIFLYIITKYMNSSEAGYANEVIWTGDLNNENREEPIVTSESLSDKKVSDMQNYGGEFGSRLHTYKSTMQGR
jgi:hypothetical protein